METAFVEDAAMPHVDLIAKLELEAINDLLCDGRVGDAAVLLGKFLDNVHVLESRRFKDTFRSGE